MYDHKMTDLNTRKCMLQFAKTRILDSELKQNRNSGKGNLVYKYVQN